MLSQHAKLHACPIHIHAAPAPPPQERRLRSCTSTTHSRCGLHDRCWMGQPCMLAPGPPCRSACRWSCESATRRSCGPRLQLIRSATRGSMLSTCWKGRRCAASWRKRRASSRWDACATATFVGMMAVQQCMAGLDNVHRVQSQHSFGGTHPLLSLPNWWSLCSASLQAVMHSACRPSGSASCMKWRSRACLQNTGQSWPERSSATGSRQHCSSESEAMNSSAQPDAARCRAEERHDVMHLHKAGCWHHLGMKFDQTSGSGTGSDLQSLTDDFVDQN